MTEARQKAWEARERSILGISANLSEKCGGSVSVPGLRKNSLR